MANIVPDSSAQALKQGGLFGDVWMGFFRRLGRGQADLTASVEAIESGKASTSQEWCETLHIRTVENAVYRLLDVPHNGTITRVSTQAQSGTCTATVGVNGATLGGSANSVSTTKQTRTHTDRNTVQPGDDITVTVTSNSTCIGMAVTIRGTGELNA